MISAEFPYESKYMNVLGSRMHYIDEGQGQVFLFLHGNPTSSYLWRNIIPYVLPHGRAVAVDLIGMGKSGKPDIDYTFRDHAKYLDVFIETLGLQDIILIIHDWGSALGFYYAHRYETNVRGIVFMEAILKPITSWSEMKFIERFIFKRFRHPVKGPKMIVKKNFFIEKVLPMFTIRKLTAAEMEYYRQPFLDEKSRKPLLVWPNQIPIAGQPQENVEIVSAYHEWLKETNIPKLFLWAKPGAIIKEKQVEQICSAFKNIKNDCVGKGKHYIQEDCSRSIGEAIASWYKNIW